MELGLIVPIDMQSSEQKVSDVSYILATIMAREWWNIKCEYFDNLYTDMKRFTHECMV